jgi:hypothetical protein
MHTSKRARILTYSKLHRSAIECKEGLCISRLAKLELLLELKIEQKNGTSLDSPCYKPASSLKRSVRGQYRLSVPVIYFNISIQYYRELAYDIIQGWQADFRNVTRGA